MSRFRLLHLFFLGLLVSEVHSADVTTEVGSFYTLAAPTDAFSISFLYVGDFSGNGLEDVLVVGRPGPSSEYVTNPASYPRYLLNIVLQETSGQFRVATADLMPDNMIYGSEPSVVIFDFNQDGVDDIFVAGGTDTEYRVESFLYLSNESGSFSRQSVPTFKWIHGIDAYDIDGDGIPEIFTAGYDPSHLYLKYVDGVLEMREYVNRWAYPLWGGSAIAVSDFTGTGKLQAVRTDDGQHEEATTLYDLELLESGDLQFTKVGVLPSPRFELPKWDFLDVMPGEGMRSHDVKLYKLDVTNNGRDDLIVSSWPWRSSDGSWQEYSELQILVNIADGVFADETDTRLVGFDTSLAPTHYIRFIDINNDGFPDMFLDAHAFERDFSKRILMNTGRGSFIQVDSEPLRAWAEHLDTLKYSEWGVDAKSTAMTIVRGEGAERYLVALTYPWVGEGHDLQFHRYRGKIHVRPLHDYYTQMITHFPDLDEPRRPRRGLPAWLHAIE